MNNSEAFEIILLSVEDNPWLLKEWAGKPLIHQSINAALQSEAQKVSFYTNQASLAAAVSEGFPALQVTYDTHASAAQLWEKHQALDKCAILQLNPAAVFINSTQLNEAYNQWLKASESHLISVSKLQQNVWRSDGKVECEVGNEQVFYLENRILSVGYFEHYLHSMPASAQICKCYVLPPQIQVVENGPSYAASVGCKAADPSTKGANIKVFLTDVDGVMTDSGMYYIEGGKELKKFHVHDGMALQRLQQSGVKTGIITSEDTEIVSKRAAKLKVDFLHQGKRFGGKLQAAQAICEQEGITLQEIAYIGDDINCIELLQAVGIAACPANATRHVKAIPGIWQLEREGGQGVVREMIEKLFPEVI